MVVYLYDGTFEGLLTAIYEGYYLKKKPDSIINENRYNRNLLDEEILIFSDEEKASKVGKAINDRLSTYVFSEILNCFLSEDYDAGTVIFKYLIYGFKIGRRSIDNLSIRNVSDFVKLSTKVKGETHRMLGLLRFTELKSGILYSRMEPTYNISMLIAPHFAERMNNEIWVIHDLKRELGIFYNKEKWHIAELKESEYVEFSNDEQIFQNLWKKYFKTIAIEEKINPKLQMSMMPKKYWKHLIEKNGNI